MSWDPWSSVSDGHAAPGSSVTAAQVGAGRFAVFIADPNGGVYTTTGSAEQGWNPWSSVSEGHAAPGSNVTAVPLGAGRFAVFIADPNGGVYTTTGNAEQGWNPWSSVSEGHAAPGSSVTAVEVGPGRFAVFIADPNGGVYTTTGSAEQGWNPWSSVSEGHAAPGSSVTALQLGGGRFAVFIADPNGGVYTTMGSAEHGWGPWSSVSEGQAAPGSSVTAVPAGSGRLALFIADPGGGVFTTTGGEEHGWGPWSSVSGGHAAPGSSVTAVEVAASRFAVFVADPGGGVFTTTGNAEGWEPWTSVAEGHAAPGSSVTAIPLGGGRFAVFVADPGGGVYATTGNAERFAAPAPSLGVAPANILEIFQENPTPPVDLTDPGWTKTIVAGTFPDGEAEEWKQVFPVEVGEDFDDNVVAASGWVVEPEFSGSDLPFAHPFGFDWEFSIAVDSQYESLVPPANSNPKEAVERAQALGLPVPVDRLLGVEMEKGMVPIQFRDNVFEGDRVAVFGRWIVDTGHDFEEDGFRTELHPPLLMVTAGEKEVDGARVTRAVFTSRPYLVGQTYQESNFPFARHLVAQIEEVIGVPVIGNPFDYSVAAQPHIKAAPFRGPHLMRIAIRPPALPPVQHATSVLSASFTFFVRSNVAVEVRSPDDGTVEVDIVLNGEGYEPLALPHRTTRRWDRGDLDALNSDVGDKYLSIEFLSTLAAALITGPINAAKVAAVLNRGILADEYDTAAMEGVVIFDPAHGVYDVRRDAIHLGGIVTDDDQPYPLLGWMDLKWVKATEGSVLEGGTATGGVVGPGIRRGPVAGREVRPPR